MSTNCDVLKGICLPVKKDGAFAYNIHIEKDFDHLSDYVAELGTAGRRICLISDSSVFELYGEKIRSILEPICQTLTVFVFPAGERSKNLATVQDIYRHLIENSFDRHDLIAALGGGVVGDMAGYAAATYLRGIRFIQIPTTLLAQVDSSIGGKTGVDFDQYKNMVGAFHMPSLVYASAEALSTLNEEQFACGMGEVLKHGLIRDSAYYEWTLDHMSEIAERDTATLMEMVHGSCLIKRRVVENDPTEKGERALLNFGHTIGHAIEKLKDFSMLHGQCVSLGCVCAAHISWKRGLLDDGEFYELRDMMVGFDLPITVQGLDPQEIIETTRHDKKMSAGQIRFVLLEKIGKAFIAEDVTDEEMLAAIRSIDADQF